MSSLAAGAWTRLLAPRILAVVIALIGVVLTVGGAQLAALGGSLYYVITGLACLASGFFLWTGRMLGVWIFAAMLAWTLVWAIWEVGFNGWALMPRLVGPFVIGLYMALPFNWRPLRGAPNHKAA
jgi:Glucose dehydrogenase